MRVFAGPWIAYRLVAVARHIESEAQVPAGYALVTFGIRGDLGEQFVLLLGLQLEAWQQLAAVQCQVGIALGEAVFETIERHRVVHRSLAGNLGFTQLTRIVQVTRGSVVVVGP
ncbi:hypothetical protein D3C81_1817100 [compost metagenome]